MDTNTMYLESNDVLEIAFSCEALFDQYDEQATPWQANDDCYENLYPNVA